MSGSTPRALALGTLALVCAASVFAAPSSREPRRTERFTELHGLPPVVIPGQAQASALVGHIEGRIAPRMPPGRPLAAEQIAAIRKWIDGGAGKDAFAKDVAMIVKAHCTLCHGDSVSGNLRLDSYEALKPRIAP